MWSRGPLMACPDISESEVKQLFPGLMEISPPIRGGQKLVFPCKLGNACFVLKILRSNLPAKDRPGESAPPDEVFARAEREVAILKACQSPHLPRVGPVELVLVNHKKDRLIVFSEEFVAGRNVAQILQANGPFREQEAIVLGQQMAAAIGELWKHGKIHRDIKPENIMRRDQDGTYVLLDAGIAFDTRAKSITAAGLVPHTPGFLAPEHANPLTKRDADLRADFFLLGIVLYIVSTGRHPFITRQDQPPQELVRNIVTLSPAPPHKVRSDLSRMFSDMVMRLLEKKKHRRFRNCAQLFDALGSVPA